MAKKWLLNFLPKRSEAFKASLQAVEKNVWRNTPFQQKLFWDQITLNNSLAESMRLKGDHVYVSLLNEFDHKLDADFEEKLVTVDPSFSDANEFFKDVQLTFDENLVNNYLQALFNSNRVLSLKETIISWLPDQVKIFASAISALFTTSLLSKPFPSLITEYGYGKQVDIKCGFSKRFLSGKLQDTHTSQIWFKEGNIVEWSFHFGCGIFVGGEADADSLIREAKEGKAGSNDLGMYRSFFVGAGGRAELEFKPSFLLTDLFMQGHFKDFDLDIKELKIFGRDDSEIFSEEGNLTRLLQMAIAGIKGSPIGSWVQKVPFL